MDKYCVYGGGGVLRCCDQMVRKEVYEVSKAGRSSDASDGRCGCSSSALFFFIDLVLFCSWDW